MVRARIIGWGEYLPQRVVTNHDLAETMETSDDWIATRTGIRQRHVAGENEKTSDLATKAAEKAMQRAGVKPEDIDMVILATASPDHTFPATAARVQANLGIRQGAAFDIAAVCAGFIFALATANNFIQLKQAKTILVIGAETFTRLLDWQDRRTAVLFGDGAGAVVVQATSDTSAEASSILGIELQTDGTLYDILNTSGGPSSTQTSGTVFMEGKEVFRHAVTKLVDVAQALLAAHQFTPQDLDWLIPHQANQRIIEATGKRLGIPEEKTVITVDKHANTSAASIPLALCSVAEKIQPGQLVLLEGLGAGISWGAALLRW